MAAARRTRAERSIQRSRLGGDGPKICTDGERMVVSLDGNPGLDKSGRVIVNPTSLREPVKFSVSRSGKLKFAHKIHKRLVYTKRPKLDEYGNKIPNPKREVELSRWGRSYQPEFVIERIPQQEPEVRVEYHVDPDWGRRHLRTKVLF